MYNSERGQPSMLTDGRHEYRASDRRPLLTGAVYDGGPSLFAEGTVVCGAPLSTMVGHPEIVESAGCWRMGVVRRSCWPRAGFEGTGRRTLLEGWRRPQSLSVWCETWRLPVDCDKGPGLAARRRSTAPFVSTCPWGSCVRLTAKYALQIKTFCRNSSIADQQAPQSARRTINKECGQLLVVRDSRR